MAEDSGGHRRDGAAFATHRRDGAAFCPLSAVVHPPPHVFSELRSSGKTKTFKPFKPFSKAHGDLASAVYYYPLG